MKFFLGTHMPNWLGLAQVPLFVSDRRLRKRRTFPRALAEWALDSGGFTELNTYGAWKTSAPEYISSTRRYTEEIGQLEWVSPQDWMCEPVVMGKTGLTVREHQKRTVTNYLTLRTAAAEIPFIPVLQGWTLPDYHRCAELYELAGIHLAAEPIVGIGSVCRRQSTTAISNIVESLQPLNLHGFGVKDAGLRRYGSLLASSDSMAWSFGARHRAPLPGHTHARCSSCLEYALQWRRRLLNKHGAATTAAQDTLSPVDGCDSWSWWDVTPANTLTGRTS